MVNNYHTYQRTFMIAVKEDYYHYYHSLKG